MPITQGTPQGQYNPFQGMNIPSFSFNPVQGAGMAPSYENIMKMISAQPMSMVNQLMPGLSQILGTQTQQMLPMLQQQTSGLESGIQSMMQQRGLTGSSIEAAGLLGAEAAGQQNVNQFLAQQLGQLGQAYTGAVGADVGAQNQMYQNLAQAMGQQMQSQLAQNQFQQMLAAQQAMASQTGKAGMWGAAIQGGLQALPHFFPCDIRLKTNIKKLGDIDGLGIYSYEYRKDTNLNLPSGKQIGFMAQEVERKYPEAVFEIEGYKALAMDILENKLVK